ncbi:hypothetical protein [Sulfitobacter sp. SK012]|uniref:hypothetical protein n=1 Tax=Sulfitobacter sp. SK012 TaxID=1389005 RepID=UPI0013B37538|nr:hypothetical protein [Sulfitobacter sp. SK012]
MTGQPIPYLRRDRSPLNVVTLKSGDMFPSLDAAYAALAAEQARTPTRIGGWKIGGSNLASSAAFGVDVPYYGAVEHSEILFQPRIAPGYELFELKGEVEIALRLNADMTGYDAWCVALEMPSSPVQGLPEIGVIALVSDRCATGALVLGAIHEAPLPDLSTARFTQDINGERAADEGFDQLIGSPDAILQHFLGMARQHGAALAAGQWVATGGITPCLPYQASNRVQVNLDGEPQLDITIDMGPL